VYDLACGPLSDTEWCSRSDWEAVKILLHVFRSANEFPSLPLTIAVHHTLHAQ
jgi:hypothetical protein